MNSPSLLRGTSIVAVLTACSRALGFIRDMIIASVFGASLVTDAFFVAFRLPNLLRSMVAEGALTSAFVPVFSHELEKDANAANATFRSMTGVLLILTVVLSSCGILFANQLIALFAPGFSDSQQLFSLCTSLTQLMFPYIIFVSLIALINGALNSKGIFGAAPFAQIIMNMCLAIGALSAIPYTPTEGIYLLAVSVLVGGLMQVLVLLPALKKTSLILLPRIPLITRETTQILFLMIPAVAGAAAYQLSMLVNTVLASLLQTGAVSWLFFADRVSQLPVGIFTISLGSVLLPTLSRSAANNDVQLFGKELTNALRYTSFVLIPLSGYLFCFADDIVPVLFGRGNFSNFDVSQTAIALKGVSIGLWGVGCNYLCMRAFLAHKNTVIPTAFGIVSVSLTLIFALLSMGPISPSDSKISTALLLIQEALAAFVPSINIGHTGLALSSGLASTVLFPVSIMLLSARGYLTSSMKHFLLSSCKAMIITAALIWFNVLAEITLDSELLSLILNSLISLSLFILMAFFFRLNEMQETYTLFMRKIRKRT